MKFLVHGLQMNVDKFSPPDPRPLVGDQVELLAPVQPYFDVLFDPL